MLIFLQFPIILSLVCRMAHAGGYLLVNLQINWPVESLYLMTFLEALGGGNSGILSSTISYISDVSSEEHRTSRVSTANSFWFLGGPMGTLLAALLIHDGDYNLPLMLVFVAYMAAILYVTVFIKESLKLDPDELKGKKEASLGTKLKDFFDWHRILESFKTAFKRRTGRLMLFFVLAGNMARRFARSNFLLFSNFPYPT